MAVTHVVPQGSADETKPEERHRGSIVIVGREGGSNIGASFHRAASTMGRPSVLCDQLRAYGRSRVIRALAWRLMDKRPLYRDRFSAAVWAECRRTRATVLLATGCSPLSESLLERCRHAGVATAVFLTDDPFNPAHRSRWFLRTLGGYSAVFTPRRANMQDLCAAGARNVVYLPFGYDPELFFPPPAGIQPEFGADVFFAGGADTDRVPMIAALHRAGLSIHLNGSYWEDFPETRMLTRGQVEIPELRRAAWTSRTGLCCCRLANRDGHSMRTFELAAMEVCMVVEDTEDHRRFFGADGAAVEYFADTGQLVAKTARLVREPDAILRLRRAAGRLISTGNHRYSDRLTLILETLMHRPA